MENTKGQIFLIAPVRGLEADAHKPTVQRLESMGYRVYWPARDTSQDDSTGYRICVDNRRAIAESDGVAFIWDGKSQGCLFDLGIAFALRKPLIPIELPEQSDGKSFQNMARDWGEQSLIAGALERAYR